MCQRPPVVKEIAAEQRFGGTEHWSLLLQLERKAHPQLRWWLGLQISSRVPAPEIKY